MSYFLTSESVSEGHPDKVADQISDAILDAYLIEDPNSKVACETLCTENQVILAGEVTSSANIDTDSITRNVIKNIGYDKSEYGFNYTDCNIESYIHKQSSDILQGVDKGSIENQGAGDQGIIFGYAINETNEYMPLPYMIANSILKELSKARKNNEITYLGPDAKSQVTIEYQDEMPVRIDTIIVSTQHQEFADDETMHDLIYSDIVNVIIKRALKDYSISIDDNTKILVNPTGKFVIGGPAGDTGLTGRKIIVDTYGGFCQHGGGAFSGKDPSKVDRSAAYACRHIAKNLVAAGIASEIVIQVSYAIGYSKPISLYINTFNTSKYTDTEIINCINTLFDLRPGIIEQDLKLKNPIYSETASYGHFGRNSEIKLKVINGNRCYVELFTWEKLDYVDKIKKYFNI